MKMLTKKNNKIPIIKKKFQYKIKRKIFLFTKNLLFLIKLKEKKQQQKSWNLKLLTKDVLNSFYLGQESVQIF